MVVEAQRLLPSEASATAPAVPSSPAAPSPSLRQAPPAPRFHASWQNALYMGEFLLNLLLLTHSNHSFGNEKKKT